MQDLLKLPEQLSLSHTVHAHAIIVAQDEVSPNQFSKLYRLLGTSEHKNQER